MREKLADPETPHQQKPAGKRNGYDCRMKKIAAFLFVSIFVCPPAKIASAATVRVAVPTLSMVVVAFTAAKERNYYNDEGLDVQFIWMSAPIAAQALLGGNVEFATVSGSAIPAILGGAPMRFLLTSYNRPMFWLFSRPEIDSVKALKGKKVAVSGLGSGPATLLVDILKRNGLEGGRDVAILSLGRMPDIAAGLLNGSVDAAMIAPPLNITVKEAGFRELVSFLKEDFVEFQGSIVARDEILKSDPLLTEKFVRATLKGLLYARENRAGTIPIVARYLKVKEEFAAKYYDSVRPVMTANGTVPENLQRSFLKVAIERLHPKDPPPPEKIFDYTLTKKFYNELQASGWKPK
jgi:ABC-type nitrate/sulfonate/bicarbonate transport system substrate-binding protein